MRILSYLFLISSSVLSAQNLMIASGHSVNINTNASININGLKLTPSSVFTINGVNNINRSSTAITIGSNSSINRVFGSTNLIDNFLGDIEFNYEDSELNGLDESILELYVKDDLGAWNSFPGTLDTSSNTITNTFSSAISFMDITAAQNDVTLSIESIGLTTIRIFPNPTTSIVNIDYTGDIEVKIYNTLGQLLLKTQEKIIDISAFDNATYFFLVRDLLNSTTNTYKIIKQ